MVQRLPPTLVVAPLDEWEIGHPQRAPFARRNKAQAPRQLQPQSTQRLCGDPGLVGNQQEQVARRSLESRGHRVQLLLGEELRDRRPPAAPLLYICPDEAARTLPLGE